MSASFKIDENGLEHQIPMPDVPPPEDLLSSEELKKKVENKVPEKFRKYLKFDRPIDIRSVELLNAFAPEKMPPFRNVWFKTKDALPEDRKLHEASLAYASDFFLLSTSMFPHGISYFTPGLHVASLDHAVWYHRPVKADQWLLYTTSSPSTSGARGFNIGHVFDRDGTLIASVVQEGLMRLKTKP